MVADQNYLDGITKNQKDALRNKAKKFVIRDGLLYYCDNKRGERQVGAVCVCMCVCMCLYMHTIIQVHSA